MKITDVQVDGFGVWSNLTLGALSDRLTVFFGPNEAGKTTLLQFVRSVLYGMSSARCRQFAPPHGGHLGGALGVALPEGRFHISRHTVPGSPTDGRVDVRAEDGSVEDRPLLNAALKDIDETTFNNVFAVGLRELQELGALNNTDAATWLYSLTAGLDRVSLVEVMRELEASRDRLVAPDDTPCELSRLRAEHERLSAELNALPTMAGRWADVRQRRLELEQRMVGLQAERDSLERDARWLEIAVEVKDPWQQRASLDRQLADTVGRRKLPADAMTRMRRLAVRYKRCRRRRDRLEHEARAAGDEAKRLGGNEAFVRQGPRIEALGEQLDWVASLENQLRDHERQVTGLASQLDTEQRRFGVDRDASAGQLTDAARRAVPGLKRPARALRTARDGLSAAERQAAACRESASEAETEIRNKLADWSEKDLPAAVEAAAHLASQLRQRVGLDERLDEMARHQVDLEQRSRDLLEQQILPFRVLVGLGTLFVAGVAMMLSGLWFPTLVLGPLGKTLAVLGILGTVASGLLKFLLERLATNRLDSCRRQIDLLSQQAAEAREQRDALDRRLPPGGGALTRRLQEAQRDLQSLEQLLPLDARKQTAERDAVLADEAIACAQEQIDAARSEWRQALVSTGLPTDLGPGQVRDLARHSDQIVSLRSQFECGRDELDQRRREYDTLTTRIRRLATDLGFPVEDRSASDVLRQMLRQWEGQKPDMQRRSELRRRAKRLRRRVPQLALAMKQLARQRKALLADAGVDSPQAFRQLALKQAHIDQLQHDRDTLNREILASIDGQATEDDIAGCLANDADDPMETRWDRLTERLSQTDKRLAECLTERGALGEEEKQLTEDRRRGAIQLELATLRQRLHNALETWQVRATAWMLLDDVRREYEKHRQPETLSEASEYLKKLTEQRYVKVWTPLDEDVLYVNDDRGRTLPVEVLSRGTREQLFLCLRLALVSFYARRGVCLPLVLDDVLVNFDAQRAKAAARLMRDFTKAGHQLLVFTCHEHVWRVFKSMRVDARRLPVAGEVPEIHAAAADDEGPRPAEPEVRQPEPHEEYVEVERGARGEPVEELPEDPVEEEEYEVEAWEEVADRDQEVNEAPVEDAEEYDLEDEEIDYQLEYELEEDLEGDAPEESAAAEIVQEEEVADEEADVTDVVEEVEPVASEQELATDVDDAQEERPSGSNVVDGRWVRIGAQVRRRNMVAPPPEPTESTDLASAGRHTHGRDADAA